MNTIFLRAHLRNVTRNCILCIFFFHMSNEGNASLYFYIFDKKSIIFHWTSLTYSFYINGKLNNLIFLLNTQHSHTFVLAYILTIMFSALCLCCLTNLISSGSDFILWSLLWSTQIEMTSPFFESSWCFWHYFYDVSLILFYDVVSILKLRITLVN